MNTPDIDVRHDDQRHRFEAQVNGQKAFLEYEPVGDDKLDYQHTFTPPEWRGRGIAHAIVEHALAYAEREGKEVIPTCPFVKRVIEERQAD